MSACEVYKSLSYVLLEMNGESGDSNEVVAYNLEFLGNHEIGNRHVETRLKIYLIQHHVVHG